MLVDVFDSSIIPISNVFNTFPMYNWYETGNAYTDEAGNYVVDIVLPGVDKSDIKLDVKPGSISVKAEHKGKTQARQVSYNKWFSLPNGLATKEATAKYENGILTVSMPKVDKSEEVSKQVKVE